MLLCNICHHCLKSYWGRNSVQGVRAQWNFLMKLWSGASADGFSSDTAWWIKLSSCLCGVSHAQIHSEPPLSNALLLSTRSKSSFHLCYQCLCINISQPMIVTSCWWFVWSVPVRSTPTAVSYLSEIRMFLCYHRQHRRVIGHNSRHRELLTVRVCFVSYFKSTDQI